jgi:uncharacterized protein (DUF2225 family)
MSEDFKALSSIGVDKATADIKKRKDEVALIAKGIDFSEPRTLISGAVSLYLVLSCYDYYGAETSPAIKQAVASVRAGWLFDELDATEPNQNWDWLAKIFKKKAGLLYGVALKLEQTGKESLSVMRNLGPDTDNNYGFDGVLYMAALLEYKYGDTENSQLRMDTLSERKRSLGKMFGMGKSSKSKPGPLLEKSKELYDILSKELNEVDA